MHFEKTCVICFLVKLWTRRELMFAVKLIISLWVRNLCCLVNCKALVKTPLGGGQSGIFSICKAWVKREPTR